MRLTCFACAAAGAAVQSCLAGVPGPVASEPAVQGGWPAGLAPVGGSRTGVSERGPRPACSVGSGENEPSVGDWCCRRMRSLWVLHTPAVVSPQMRRHEAPGAVRGQPGCSPQAPSWAPTSPAAPGIQGGDAGSAGDLPTLEEAEASPQPLAAWPLSPAQQALATGRDAGLGRAMPFPAAPLGAVVVGAVVAPPGERGGRFVPGHQPRA